MSTALIDADILVYQAAIGSTKEIDWDGTGPTTMINLPEGLSQCRRKIKSWLDKSKCDKPLLVLSDRSKPKGTFRYNVYADYKANRTGDKPAVLSDLTDALCEEFPYVSMAHLEADDVIGLMLTGPDGPRYAAVSLDKDMLTLPGKVCIIGTKGEVTRRKITPFEADYNWMHQTLTGDTVDNYKGCPGVGQIGADEALRACKTSADLIEVTKKRFITQHKHKSWGKKFFTMDPIDEFLMNARCARILRHGDYDTKSCEVRLWHHDPDMIEWI